MHGGIYDTPPDFGIKNKKKECFFLNFSHNMI